MTDDKLSRILRFFGVSGSDHARGADFGCVFPEPERISATKAIEEMTTYAIELSALMAIFFFMTTPRMRAAFSRASKSIDRASGVVFVAFGIKLATEKAG
jgi:threonine/homoserine/homoserine lactone efflux protein